ncbi:MAG: bifunctional phosphopantothenoylcysteine decarboxylase/phosphopantothenate--cysteine ligase CoaBC [Candidatus Aminicenantaceae bacterium]
MLAGKTVVLGISGGIAAYQAIEIVGQLRNRLADVYVIMTRAATKFITPLSLETVSLHPVVTDMFSEPKQWNIPHISLAQRADIFLIAPATANIIGKIVNGIADDILSTTIMATKAPVLIAPAMNENMWLNSVVQNNIEKLKKLGYQFVGPEYGPMACGGEGLGRLARIEAIISKLIEISKKIDKAEKGKKK